MRDIAIGVVTIAAGILLAVFILAGVVYLMAPAQTIQVSLSQYHCVTDGKSVICERKP